MLEEWLIFMLSFLAALASAYICLCCPIFGCFLLWKKKREKTAADVDLEAPALENPLFHASKYLASSPSSNNVGPSFPSIQTQQTYATIRETGAPPLEPLASFPPSPPPKEQDDAPGREKLFLECQNDSSNAAPEEPGGKLALAVPRSSTWYNAKYCPEWEKEGDPDLRERHRQVFRALMSTDEPRKWGLQETPHERKRVRFTKVARQKHICQNPLTIEIAELMSAGRREGIFSNTVLEEPEAYDVVFFHGFGNKIVTRNKVRTVLCKKFGERWSGSYQGRCYGIFERSGHLLYRTTLKTAEMRKDSAGLANALTLA